MWMTISGPTERQTGFPWPSSSRDRTSSSTCPPLSSLSIPTGISGNDDQSKKTQPSSINLRGQRHRDRLQGLVLLLPQSWVPRSPILTCSDVNEEEFLKQAEDYLKQRVLPSLYDALAGVAVRRPADPVVSS